MAFVSLVIGMFLLLQGSKMSDPVRDLIFIVVGAVLVLAYMPLTGNYLEAKFKAPRNITLMPMLLVLGVMLVYQGAVRSVFLPDKVLLIVLGGVLAAGAAFMLGKFVKKKP
jgi:hypothetical protein